MRIHKEGRITLLLVAVTIVVVNYALIKFVRNDYISYSILVASSFLYLFLMWFFRVPNRPPIDDPNAIIAPCDGKVVVIESCHEDEFLKTDTTQISIFMSPLNIHMNWFPISGDVLYKKMHKGSHFVAWAPKSSTHNERSSVAIQTQNGEKIMLRQIAGALARRVVCYANKGQFVAQNEHLGFIKFGSRVDVFVPKDAEIKVEINQNVTGTQTILARLKA